MDQQVCCKKSRFLTFAIAGIKYRASNENTPTAKLSTHRLEKDIRAPLIGTKTNCSELERNQASAQQFFELAVRALQFFEQRQQQRLIHVRLGFGIGLQTVDACLIEFRCDNFVIGKDRR